MRGHEEAIPMTRKTLHQAALASGVALAAASVTVACGQGADSEPSVGSSVDALKTVLDCQTQVGVCVQSAKTVADVTACNGALRSCLLSLFPDAGAPRFLGPLRFDASFPPLPTFPTAFPGFDAAPPVLPVFDAGAFPPPRFDAGLPPFPIFDAGRPPPPPAAIDAGVPSQGTCLVNLQACLFSQTSPTTCADHA